MAIHFITYGAHDRNYQTQLPNIHIHTNRWIPDGRVYPRLIPILHAPTLMTTSVIKTHQMLGAKFAIQAGKLYRKPVIFRQGFMWSTNEASLHQYDVDHPRIQHIRRVEAHVWSQSTRIIVTSHEMKEDIVARLPEVAERVHVIPNNIDTALFRPIPLEKTYDLVFVGRLEKMKNLFALIDAVKRLSDVSLLLVGQGALQRDILGAIRPIQDRVTYYDRVPNEQLPYIYNQARVFILPSLYEGMPKVLLEAMACGLPVIGTNVRGIREVVQHGENGWLSDTNSDALSAAISTMLAHPQLQQRLGQNARQTILDHYSLDQLANREYELIRDVVDNSSSR
jgi:glycosyltransferase involved in cell wall biosynthesis